MEVKAGMEEKVSICGTVLRESAQRTAASKLRESRIKSVFMSFGIWCSKCKCSLKKILLAKSY